MWEVLTENLGRKHGVTPVHTIDEMQLLMDRFPDEIKCICGKLDDRIVAGIVVFSTPTVHHTQYIASSQQGYEVSALDAVFEHCIDKASSEGKHWFDFGISTETDSRILNKGLYEFKSEFGAGGFLHEFFRINLIT
jgi:lipid II:glycine glycyltransferase (peptidoglycan interpeptide bridge formation enzyme)